MILRKALILIWTARRRIRLMTQLLGDHRIARWKKLILLLPLIYVLSPLNFLSFALPLVGGLDDIVLFFLAMDLFERTVDEKIINEYKQQLGLSNENS
ncbi:hypothetical protein MASR2M15_13740 [Anaerolineales bacterium]